MRTSKKILPKLTTIAAATLGLLLPAGDAVAAPANSWPMAGYNTARSNLNPLETTLNSTSIPGLQLQRTIPLGATSEECGVVETTPVVNGDILYTTAGTDLVAHNLTTGRELWRSTIDSLVVSGSRMILSGRNGTAYFAGYDTATFTMLWGNDSCAPDPVRVVGGALVATCPTEGTPKSLKAYSLVDGQVLWSKAGNWRPRRGDTDVAGATVLYASNPAGYLTALAPSTGAITWTSATQRGRVLAVGKKRLYVTCDGTALCALSRTNGSRVWKKPANGLAVTSVVVASDVVYPAPSMWPRLASTGANIVLGIPYAARDAGDHVIVASGRLIVTNVSARTIKIYGL